MGKARPRNFLPIGGASDEAAAFLLCSARPFQVLRGGWFSSGSEGVFFRCGAPLGKSLRKSFPASKRVTTLPRDTLYWQTLDFLKTGDLALLKWTAGFDSKNSRQRFGP